MSAAHPPPGHGPNDVASARMRLRVLPQLRHWVLWPALMGGAVSGLGFTMKNLPDLTSAEFAIDQEMSAHHTGVLNVAALSLDTLFADRNGAILLAAAFLYLLIIRRAPVNAIAFSAVAAVGWLSCYVVKAIVVRPRPDQTLLTEQLVMAPDTHSFPSGQVCLATALAFALCFLARGTVWHKPAVGFGIVMVLVVALSRLYLGVHYPADVFASVVTASGAILFFSGLWNRYGAAIISKMAFLAWFGPLPGRAGENTS